ncbi:MAG: NADPH-dependent F420 reductase [Kofleriaceae bacterium]|nr:NADPH-dependent F420 reductase [Kofleriaceae bacterium]MCB9573830.1 NADPH-dependent F420 reductase [Kofleriaceae bacterium]
MRIGILGGTGKEGRGLAMRWARAGHHVVIGSRDPERATIAAAELAARAGAGGLHGGALAAATDAEVVVVSVPYPAQAATLEPLRAALAGRIVLDLVVPLVPPKVARVHLPPGGAAALEAQALLGADARVVAALHHVSSTVLDDLDHPLGEDVLVAGDDADAKAAVIALVADLGGRGLDAGPLANAVALEAMTPVLIHLNKRYRRAGLGLRIAGLDGGGEGAGA